MGAPPPWFYVRPDEEVLLRRGPGRGYAFVLFLRTALALTLAAVVLVTVAGATESAWLARAAQASYPALLLLGGLVAWRRAVTTEHVLTGKRVYARRGRLMTSVHFTTHDKVTDLRIVQGPLQRLFGVSTVTFATAGGDVRMSGVVDALAMKGLAEEARDRHVQRLLEQAGVEAARRTETPLPAAAPDQEPFRPLPAPPLPPWRGPRPAYLKAGDEPAWYDKPRPVSAASSLKGFGGLLFLVVFAQSFPPATRGWIPVGVLALFLLLFGMRVLQLRRTEYVATARRVYARSGVFGTDLRQLTYDKITDITYKQDVPGRLFGYGTVVLNTAGSEAAAITMHGLRDPLGVKETVDRLRARDLQEDAR